MNDDGSESEQNAEPVQVRAGSPAPARESLQHEDLLVTSIAIIK